MRRPSDVKRPPGRPAVSAAGCLSSPPDPTSIRTLVAPVGRAVLEGVRSGRCDLCCSLDGLMHYRAVAEIIGYIMRLRRMASRA